LCSAFDLTLGLPTFLCGAVTAAVILAANRQAPWPLLRHVAWSVLPLVAGLFVLVEALAHTGLIATLAQMLDAAARASESGAAWSAGIAIAVACNLMNNLPVGLIVGSVLASDHVSPTVAGAALIGVDLGPNLSVTGSLATILWLLAVRREGQDIGAWRFLALGLVVMPPALILAIGTLVMLGPR
jgi:arsenical pump membrane protein